MLLRNLTGKFSISEPGRLWDFSIFILSLAAIFGVTFPLIARPDSDIVEILECFDAFACLVFLCDVFWRWLAQGARKDFWLTGWLDLFSSVPYFYWLRYGRLFSIYRIVRNSPRLKRVALFFFRDRMGILLAFSTLAFLCSIWVCGILILHFERSVDNALIRTPFEAFWFASETVTTVGYGDIYPVTWQGRTIAVFLMFFGIGVFSLNSGLWASWLMKEFHIKNFEKRAKKIFLNRKKNCSNKVTLKNTPTTRGK